ncbi:hypothetical protein [Exiguobacterium antarcticum]|uniref:hypothetical protein n=1 Tax=Exiguobacterium antarcticum TaxID=132920 RepID=UPI000478E919|nr:hypothetical protein [Exiguobacterium antarcticum]
MIGSALSITYLVLLLLIAGFGLLFGSILLLKQTIRGRYAGFYLIAAAIFPAAMLITSVEGGLVGHLFFETNLFLSIVAWLLVLSSGYMVMVTAAVTLRYVYRYTSILKILQKWWTHRFHRPKPN